MNTQRLHYPLWAEMAAEELRRFAELHPPQASADKEWVSEKQAETPDRE